MCKIRMFIKGISFHETKLRLIFNNCKSVLFIVNISFCFLGDIEWKRKRLFLCEEQPFSFYHHDTPYFINPNSR